LDAGVLVGEEDEDEADEAEEAAEEAVEEAAEPRVGGPRVGCT
jgi:hypothetical protein